MLSRAHVAAISLADNDFESRISKYTVYLQHFVIRGFLKIEPLKFRSVIKCGRLGY